MNVQIASRPKIYRKWFPGQAYGALAGLGFCVAGDPSCDPTAGGVDTSGDGSGGTVSSMDPLCDPSVDPSCGQDVTTGVPSVALDPNGVSCPRASLNASGYCPSSTPAAGSAAGTASGLPLALTAAQLSAALLNQSVRPNTACPGGYANAAGQCITVTTPGVTPAGQWFPGVTNAQVTTWGFVVIGALVVINLIPSGGGRRRR